MMLKFNFLPSFSGFAAFMTLPALQFVLMSMISALSPAPMTPDCIAGSLGISAAKGSVYDDLEKRSVIIL